MVRNPRLLVIGHACTPTGYARVMHSILPYLCSNYEIHHLGINIHEVTGDYPWAIYGKSHPFDAYGVADVKRLAIELQPELILISTNHFYLPMVANQLKIWSPNSKVIAYIPVEGDLLPELETRTLLAFDAIGSFTQYGIDCMHHQAIRHGIAPEQLPPMQPIVHGLDFDVFHPLVAENDQVNQLQSQQQARQLLWPDQPELADAFVVLNGNRNQYSKRIDLTLEGFSRFAKDKPQNVKLFLNMARADAGHQIDPLISRFELTDRVIVAREKMDSPGFTSQQLNWLYNACDVGINTSLGEGWGLVPFEHAATGRPQLIANHSATSEIWKNYDGLIDPPNGPSCYPAASSNTAIDPGDLTEKLELLYSDPTHYTEQAQEVYNLVHCSKFDWRNVAQQWDRLFAQCL